MPAQGVFPATIIGAVAGTLMMAFYANLPYAQAPGMGLNAFFTFTVVFGLGYSWQEALAMVFICGIISLIITLTNVRKMIIESIPNALRSAISAGIGVFLAYVGIKNAGLLKFSIDPGTTRLQEKGLTRLKQRLQQMLQQFQAWSALIIQLFWWLLQDLLLQSSLSLKGLKGELSSLS